MNNMTSHKKWYAIYTKPKWEKRVDQLLKNKGIESYCPLNKVCRQWSDRKKIVLEPLFISYVFVQLTEAMFNSIKEVDGVINLVYWLGKPAVIRDEEIQAIKEFLDTYENVQLEKAKISINDTVKIISGAFMDMEGKVIQVMNNTIKVILPSLGFAMVAPVTKVNVIKAKTSVSKIA